MTQIRARASARVLLQLQTQRMWTFAGSGHSNLLVLCFSGAPGSDPGASLTGWRCFSGPDVLVTLVVGCGKYTAIIYYHFDFCSCVNEDVLAYRVAFDRRSGDFSQQSFPKQSVIPVLRLLLPLPLPLPVPPPLPLPLPLAAVSFWSLLFRIRRGLICFALCWCCSSRLRQDGCD